MDVPVRTVSRLAPFVLAAVAVLLLPWTIALNLILNNRAVVENWDVAWTGFDLALAAVLAAVALAAYRGSAWLGRLAVAAATMLVCDAWFDVLTAHDGRDVALAVAGLAVEVPLALVCFLLARTEGGGV